MPIGMYPACNIHQMRMVTPHQQAQTLSLQAQTRNLMNFVGGLVMSQEACTGCRTMRTSQEHLHLPLLIIKHSLIDSGGIVLRKGMMCSSGGCVVPTEG